MRVRASSGSSHAPDPVEAGTAATREALDGLGGEPPAMIIVYATVRYDLPVLISAIRAVTGDTPLVGESSAGHMAGGDLTPPGTGVAVLAMTAGPYAFGIAVAENLAADGIDAGRHLARTARGAVPRHTAYATMMVFVDGLADAQQDLITGLHQVTGAAVPVIGGAAGDDRALERTYVFHDDRVLTDAAVGVWIGADHPLPVTVGHGWHPIGLPLLVTKTDGLVVDEIGGRPARAVFEENIRRGNTNDLDRIRPGGYYSTHAFGLIEPDGTHLIRGVFMTDELIHTFSPLPAYSAIQIMGCNREDLLVMSRRVAEDALRGRDASLLLVFSCIARLDILGDQGAEEADLLQAAAGAVPVFGVYTYGEFARTSSVAGYHNATVAAVAL